MKFSAAFQKQLDDLIPKDEQASFLEAAGKERLTKIKAMNAGTVEIFADGGSRGNPGPAGGGYVLFRGGEEVLRGSHFYGEMTNNQAEYLALRDALRDAYQLFPDLGVSVFMDSELVVKQMQGEYKVKNEKLKPIYTEVSRIADQFKHFKIAHVPRKDNGIADALANDAMDQGR